MKLRNLNVALEIKELSDDGTFSGYASVFGVVDLYGDVIAKGAFKQSLKEWKAKKRFPPILWQHDSRQPIGVFTEMYEDEKGLYVVGKLLVGKVEKATEAHALMKEGAVTGMSIGFMTRDDSYDEKEGVRTIKRLDLWEVSIVTFPANEEAQVDEVRSALARGQLPTPKQFEKHLCDAGFSRSQAKAVTCHGLTHLLQCEAGTADEVAEIIEAIKSLKPE